MNPVKTFFTRRLSWWKRQRTRTKVAAFVVVAIALFIVLGKGKGGNVVIETAASQDLARTVSATGTVISTTDLSLSFQKSDIVKSVNVRVGDKVRKGQILATLANAEEAAAVQSARGTLLGAQARYKKIQQGESDESVRAAETDVENARRTLYTDDLEAEQTDGTLSDTDPIITGTYNGAEAGEYEIKFHNTRNEAEYSGIEKGIITAIDPHPQPLGTKGLYITFPQTAYAITDEWKVRIPNTKGGHYATNLNAYESAKAALAIKKASARSADLEAAEADIVSAQGSLSSAQAEFEKTVIRSPSDGTVTKVDIELGDLAETYTPVITVQNIDDLYVEADVNESNVANIAVGQPVTVTYDALGKGSVFTATVSTVDLAPTVVDGIVNYKIKTLIADTADIRPGMTANLSIQTALAPDAVVIPERTITEKDGVKTVEVLIDERKQTTETRTVTTGLRGDGGLVEITSGLQAGERVVFNSK